MRYFVRYAGYADTLCGWEPRGSLNAATISEDVLPLEERLQRDGEAELREHHVATCRGVQRELQKVLKRREGASASDLNIVAMWRVERLTFQRLFGDRLDLLARANRTGPAGCRTFLFATTASFYHAMFPCTSLQRLATVMRSGRRRILAVTAEVNAGVFKDEIVYVMTENKVYLMNKNRIVRMRSDTYTVLMPCVVRYSRAAVTTRNLRMAGACLELKTHQWQVAQRALPLW